MKVFDFGAVGDGITDDTVALQAAMDAMANSPYLEFCAGKTYRITDSIRLTKSTNHRFYEIVGRGAIIKPDGAFPAFIRQPDNFDEAKQIVSSGFHIHRLHFEGDKISGQKGIELSSTYSSIIEGCEFKKLDTGLELIFALNAEVRSCLGTDCSFRHFYVRDDQSGLGGASQSNHTTLNHCRTWGRQGHSHFEIRGSNGVRLLDCIAEGNPLGQGSDYLVIWDRDGNNTAKQFEVQNLHLETTAANALIKLIDTQATTHLLRGVRTQQSNQVLLDIDPAGAGRILLEGWESLPNGTVLKYPSGSHQWRIQNSRFQGDDPANWDAGKMPDRYVFDSKAATGSPIPVIAAKSLNIETQNFARVTSQNKIVLTADKTAVNGEFENIQ